MIGENVYAGAGKGRLLTKIIQCTRLLEIRHIDLFIRKRPNRVDLVSYSFSNAYISFQKNKQSAYIHTQE
jgi:hypothetical protein